GLKALTEAAQLAHELDLGPEAMLTLRNEAIASMALVDLRVDQRWESVPPGPPSVAMDANGEKYARFERDGTLTVRGLEDNEVILHTPAPAAAAQRPLHGRSSLRFSPNGKFLAARGRPPHSPFQLWELQSGKRLWNVPAHGDWFYRDFD